MITQANLDTLVTVFGGSGFLGRHVVRALCKRGYRVRVAVRRPDLAFHLQPLGRVGQIHAVSANLRHRGSVEAAARGADIVINLVGILYEHGRQRFESVHTFGAEAVALSAAAYGARLVHVSALGTAADSPSLYARSKAMGEKLTLAAAPSATILRPSILFGAEDDFFNRFAALARMAPALPLIGGGHTRFQPVFAGDVAGAVLAAIDSPQTGGAVYDLGGPEVRDFKALMEFMLGVIGRKRLLLPIPFPAARLMAFFLQLPTRMMGVKPMLTQDQVDLLQGDNVVSAEAEAAGRTLKGLGIEGAAMEAIVPSYLWRFRKTGQFMRPAAG
jgi:uncharacterized protein YbjT (DUF2867 family)